MAEPRIFLSYAHDESSFAQSVADALRKRGIDDQEVERSELTSERLRESLRSSAALVVFLGRSMDSPSINFEIGAALGQAKTVLPVFLTHEARESAPPAVRDLPGIEASNLKPDDVADWIAHSLSAVA
jgi:TIR domain